MAKPQSEQFFKLRDSLMDGCVLIYKGDKQVGRVISHWYKGKCEGYSNMNLKMGLQICGLDPEGHYTETYYHVVTLGGGGYNKYKEGMERLFRGAENWIEENLEVKFKVEKILECDKKTPWRDWFNHWEDLLTEAGFKVIKAI